MRKNYWYLILFTFLLQAAGSRSFAQNIDFFAEVDMDEHPNLCPGKIFGDSTTDSGPKGIWSMGTYGPATIYENSKIWYLNSMSRFLTNDERDSLSAPPGSYWVEQLLIQENVEAPDYLARESNRLVSDIGMLLDWEQYENGTISYVAPPYETDKAYGFFVHIIGMGDGPDDLDNTDNNATNNWAVKKIVWGCNPVSIGVLAGGKGSPLNLYPNPASDKIGFDLEWNTAGVLNMTVRSVTGAVMLQRTEQVITTGKHHFTLNLGSGWSNGLYLLELNDGSSRICARFSVQR